MFTLLTIFTVLGGGIGEAGCEGGFGGVNAGGDTTRLGGVLRGVVDGVGAGVDFGGEERGGEGEIRGGLGGDWGTEC